MMIEVFWAIGTCVEVVLGKQSSLLNLTFLAILIMPKYGWRALLGVSAVPLVLFTLSCRWLPESPRFHMMSGNPDKALLVSALLSKPVELFRRLNPFARLTEKNCRKGDCLRRAAWNLAEALATYSACKCAIRRFFCG